MLNTYINDYCFISLNKYTNGKAIRTITSIGDGNVEFEIVPDTPIEYAPTKGKSRIVTARSFMRWVNTRKSLPRIIWANRLNLSGLYSTKPVKCTYDKESARWWSKDGDFDVKVLGVNCFDGYTTCASSQRHVEYWTRGVKDTLHRLRVWAGQ